MKYAVFVGGPRDDQPPAEIVMTGIVVALYDHIELIERQYSIK
jgi:hypothetical protein